MKNILITCILFIVAWNASAQSISRKVISTAGGTLNAGGNQINFTIGETVIATLSAGNIIITQGFEQPNEGATNGSVSLNLKMYIQGLYLSGGLMEPTLFDMYNNSVGTNNDPTATDTITVNLWLSVNNNVTGSSPAYSVRTVLHTNGSATCIFPDLIFGNNYYIAIVSRNGIETWSKSPITIGSNNSFDFSVSH